MRMVETTNLDQCFFLSVDFFLLLFERNLSAKINERNDTRKLKYLKGCLMFGFLYFFSCQAGCIQTEKLKILLISKKGKKGQSIRDVHTMYDTFDPHVYLPHSLSLSILYTHPFRLLVYDRPLLMASSSSIQFNRRSVFHFRRRITFGTIVMMLFTLNTVYAFMKQFPL